MAAPSLTYTLTNGTTADASQVMQDLNDLLNGITDGTKDLSISALTCAGTVTLNGHVNLGNSSADDLTITASLAADLVPKTDGAQNIGSAAKGLASVYLGDGGGDTIRIVPAALAADLTYTLPDLGAAGTFAFMNVAQTWTGLPLFGGGASVVAYSGTNPEVGGASPFQMTSSHKRTQVINPAGAITVRLPTTNIVAGEVVRIENRSAFAVTITSSDATTIVVLHKGRAEFTCLTSTPTTSAHWLLSDLYDRNSFTPSLGGQTTATISAQVGYWRRDIATVSVEYRVDCSAKGDGSGSISVSNLPFTSVGSHTNQTTNYAHISRATNIASARDIFASIPNTGTAISLAWERTAAADTDVVWADLTATFSISGQITYYWQH